jgi:hypothetical protein
MPVAEVIPSLMPGQGYEVRAWLVQHKYHSEFPVKVTWSAGPEFDRKVFEQDAGPDYCVSFHYWGAMLVQAQMHFADGKTALAHVYARLPG